MQGRTPAPYGRPTPAPLIPSRIRLTAGTPTARGVAAAVIAAAALILAANAGPAHATTPAPAPQTHRTAPAHP
ncbi:hypothetical protein A6P39_021155 [Streptomyces sp. FXJ1.172]|uniref:hypothetical protein n=1 Tax=Streptomyces sp. FXJ1.172 TaxID=710705 RepID=UPI0007CEFE1C|nr:hypothetical protein [Streptomyces sp. FXJ1.172]WEP00515.1 hypothetical protein A6P39_021155 [Streptomyces sp. FXJ1.172]